MLIYDRLPFFADNVISVSSANIFGVFKVPSISQSEMDHDY